MRHRLSSFAALVSLMLSAAAVSASASAAPAPRTTLPAIERQVMCVTCKIPLNVAESPQADRERIYIRGLIAEGKTETQVKHALVGQYGPAVLALPSEHGFDLAAYLVPILVVGGVLVLLALMLPKWLRRTRRGEDGSSHTPQLSSADASRLEQDLARYDA